MAFDQATRNRLQRFVNEARKLLEKEFTRQLQNDFGLDPPSGTVTPLENLPALSDAQRETARILRDTLDHYRASGDTDARTGLERILREQAFTVLNRLAALRMAEARGLLIETVGNGYQAKGFQLYARLAGSGLGEAGDTYRAFLFGVFDELSEDLPGLFSRYSPQGRLFPRESTLLPLLALINDAELDPLWAEDETVGWIYQYFNSKDERKAMRDASQAPRNSRELAVRNQFFTPRYVVEFLVDNTLGRTWYEMTQGQTKLGNSKYLLAGAETVFLDAATVDGSVPPDWVSRLASPHADRWPPFGNGTEADRQSVWDFACCVNAYQRGRNGNGPWFEQTERRLKNGDFCGLATGEIWDALFLICRSEHFDPYSKPSSSAWFAEAANEIRRRLLSGPAAPDGRSRSVRVVPYRRPRDPRTLKLLDPACGSMHFGLYAFDLFAEIYREAWAWEERCKQNAVGREARAEEGEEDEREKLSGPAGMAEGNGFSGRGISGDSAISGGREIRFDQSTTPGIGLHSFQHRGGSGQAISKGDDAIPADRARIAAGSGDPDHYCPAPELSLEASGDPATGVDLGSGPFGTGAGEQVSRHELSESPNRCPSPSAYCPLHSAYASEAAFLRDVPRLIIEHNIYGVDIDPRAAQIASLALWLRAQRAWHEAGIQFRDRPPVGQGHVVAAIAPPAENSLREQFAAGLDHLDRELFEKTLGLLKGLPESGVLLQVEQELPRLIREVFGEHGPIFRETDIEQWRKAEDRLRQALAAFARAGNATYQGRLFAQDALQGLRLIDLVRETFDVVVMNPPFGALSSGVKDALAEAYPKSKNDLLAIFVERGLELLRPGGRIGAITSRTCFFLSSFQKWREDVVLGIAEPEALADLGHGVMDDAMVEAAAYCLVKR